MVEITESYAIGLGGTETQRITNGNYQPTEPGNMFRCTREDVKISSPAPQIDKFPSVLSIYNILGSDRSRWCDWRGTPHTVGFWAKHTWPRGIDGLIEIKPFRKLRITDFAGNVEPHLFRRRITAVLPNRANTPIEIASNRIDFPAWCNSGSKHKRSFVGDRGLFSLLTLTACCNPQRSGERGNYDCGEGSDGSVVSLNKFAGTSDINAKRGLESGLIFFGGGLGVCIFVLLYAGFKDWRDGTLPKDKNRRQG